MSNVFHWALLYFFYLDDSCQSTEHSINELKTRLKRCHGFLLEELEPGYFLKDSALAQIIEPVMEDMKKKTKRTDKIDVILQHLEVQPEEKIKLVLDKLKDKKPYVYQQMFPNTEHFARIGMYIRKYFIMKSKNRICLKNTKMTQIDMYYDGMESQKNTAFDKGACLSFNVKYRNIIYRY